MISEKALLSVSYLGPVQYYSKFLLHADIQIEQHEHYQKQSYRNRCNIYGANGKQCLVIPVCKPAQLKMPIREILIDYSKPWQKNHWKSIESAYRLSPYFEFYEDHLIRFYEKGYRKKFLFDLNLELMEILLNLLGIPVRYELSRGYQKQVRAETDYRTSIHPKIRLSKDDPQFLSRSYPQVFENRHGFLPNLSIIDLLFNEGGQALELLRQSLVQEE